MLRAAFSGSSYVGIFARATDDCLLVRPDIEESLQDDLGEELGVPVVPTNVGGSGTVGALATGNENGLLVSSRVREREIDLISEAVDLPVHRPLLTRDKTDIMNQGRELGTYEDSSIQAGCNRVAPSYPETNASIEQVESAEPDGLLDRARSAAVRSLQE